MWKPNPLRCVRIRQLAAALLILHSVNLPAQYNTTPPASTVRLAFLHHSVGENWLSSWDGGLLDTLNRNKYYVVDSNYDWGPYDAEVNDGQNIGSHTDIGHWFNWFCGPNRTQYMTAVYQNSHLTGGLENSPGLVDPGGENAIVLFKSCFISAENIFGHPNDPPRPRGDYNPLCGRGVWDDSLDERYTVSNIKALYRDLLDYFSTRTDKLFILITTPPIHQGGADDAMPKLRAINTWLVTELLKTYPHTNVAVFDFSNVLTSNAGDPETNDLGFPTGSHHRYRNGKIEHVSGNDPFLAYARYDDQSGTWDDHPTGVGLQKAASEFLPLLNIAYNRWNGATGIPPDPPVLVAPANGSTGIPLAPTVQWNSSQGATSYRLQIATTSDFAVPFVDQSSLTGTQSPVQGLVPNTQYYWRMNASNAAGPGNWSTIWYFTTTGPSLPAAPILQSPVDGATGIGTNPMLQWSSVPGADSYHVQIAEDAQFTQNLREATGLNSTSQSFSGLANQRTHYWRVRAANSVGTGPWSAVWHFTTTQIPPPLAPILQAPTDGSTDIPVMDTLRWLASTGASSYRIQVSTQADFSSTILDQGGVTATEMIINGMAYSTTYYWRVNATNTGGTSGWSQVWSFTTRQLPPPPPPVLKTPVDGAINMNTSLMVSWFASAGASSYRLEVSTDSTFSTIFFGQQGLVATSENLSALAYSTVYYWRVNATNSSGTSDWSEIWRFTTSSETGVDDHPVLPSGMILRQNYPNPFSGTTHITVDNFVDGVGVRNGGNASRVSLKVFDLLGREVSDLTDEFLSRGSVTVYPALLHESGVYLYRLTIDNHSQTRLMLKLE